MLDALGYALALLGAFTCFRWLLRALAWGVARACYYQPWRRQSDGWRAVIDGAGMVGAVLMLGVLLALVAA